MYINVILSPSLGKTTVMKNEGGKPVQFLALLETSQDNRYTDEGWALQLWYSAGAEWQEAEFAPCNDLSLISGFDDLSDLKRRAYRLDIYHESIQPLQFTLRFKPEENSPWIWSKEQSGITDGRLIFQKNYAIPSDQFQFDSLFEGTNSNLAIKKASSDVSGTDLYVVSGSALPGISNVVLGAPLLLENFYALVKLSPSWMGPRQGASHFTVDRDAVMAGYVRSDGRHVVILGISGVDNCTTFVQSSDGKLILKTRNDGLMDEHHRAIVATGLEYQRTADAAFYQAREMIRALDIIQDNQDVTREDDDEPALLPAWYQTWFDGLAYCTWNGIGSELSEEKIIAALQDLSDNGINVSTLIIDDNWQSLDDNRRWVQFEANKNFPNGLAHTTSEIRKRFKNIKHIAVWHALLGYWEGISPGGAIDTNYKCTMVKWHGGHDVRVVDEPDVSRMYSDFYEFLVGAGVDSVKCDNQAAIDEFDDGTVRQRLSRAYQDAFKLHSLKWFSRKVIYCMEHSPYILFRALLPHNGPRVLFRNSDDFFPEIPSSHAWHIFANALNNIFTSHLNGLPDWDMFQSALPEYAGFHAAARCISGGPIYITDTPGQHDIALIKQMSAVTPQGHTVILRPSRVALPIDPFIAYNSNQLLKVGNSCGTIGGSSFMAVFNISEMENSELISIDDFPGMLLEAKYVIRSHRTGKIGGIYTKGQGNLIRTTLLPRGWEFYTATPVFELVHAGAEKSFYFGIFGVISAMSGAAAIAKRSTKTETKRFMISVTLKALGTLGFYISDLASRDISNLLITISGQVIPFSTVKKSAQSDTVLEVDIETAWNELGLTSGWSNEVTVIFYIE
ncbi:uncharacterized protein H6S33_011871 [Morchella sextelata]|uniref:uncharacterized protein n=1 Tax=Morchella sextelata TaxID=1174677 RepID=UPI001D05BE87|nr:uncharacterized protein H6S33_011871 [Morchella sextelata]KAH0610344.1 hypothetical protein H6S33_011871 [Morchella sextelata]